MLKERMQARKENRAWRKAESTIDYHADVVASMIEGQIPSGEFSPANAGPAPELFTQEEYMLKVGERAVKQMVRRSYFPFEYDHEASAEATVLRNLERAYHLSHEGEQIPENVYIVLNKVVQDNQESVS